MTIIKTFNIPSKLPQHNLPANILKHCNIYKQKQQKRRSLFAWICLSKFIDLEKVRFTKNGKPFLIINKKYFSLSHSFNKVAIVISNKPVGIDIERLIPLNITSSLAKRLLKTQELKKYLNAKNKSLWFTEYWTKHEAFNKLKGTKLTFNSFQKRINADVIVKYTKCKHNKRYVISCLI